MSDTSEKEISFTMARILNDFVDALNAGSGSSFYRAITDLIPLMDLAAEIKAASEPESRPRMRMSPTANRRIRAQILEAAQTGPAVLHQQNKRLCQQLAASEQRLAAAEERERTILATVKVADNNLCAAISDESADSDSRLGVMLNVHTDLAMLQRNQSPTAALDAALAKAERRGIQQGRTIELLPCGHLQQDSDDDGCWTCQWLAEARREGAEEIAAQAAYMVKELLKAWSIQKPEEVVRMELVAMGRAIRALPLERGEEK